MHEIGTVRASLICRELQDIRDILEGSLCPVRPHWRLPSPSKKGCWPSCVVPAMGTYLRSMSACCAAPGGPDRDCDVSVLLAFQRVPPCHCAPSACLRGVVPHRPRYGG